MNVPLNFVIVNFGNFAVAPSLSRASWSGWAVVAAVVPLVLSDFLSHALRVPAVSEAELARTPVEPSTSRFLTICSVASPHSAISPAVSPSLNLSASMPSFASMTALIIFVIEHRCLSETSTSSLARTASVLLAVKASTFTFACNCAISSSISLLVAHSPSEVPGFMECLPPRH